VEISTTKVKSSAAPGAAVWWRLALWLSESVIPVSLARGASTKPVWQGARHRNAQGRLRPCSHRLPARFMPGLSKEAETLLSLQSTWKQHQSCVHTCLGQQGHGLPGQRSPPEQVLFYPKEWMECFTWLKTTVGNRYFANRKNTDAIECASSVLMCWKTTMAAKIL